MDNAELIAKLEHEINRYRQSGDAGVDPREMDWAEDATKCVERLRDNPTDEDLASGESLLNRAHSGFTPPD